MLQQRTEHRHPLEIHHSTSHCLVTVSSTTLLILPTTRPVTRNKHTMNNSGHHFLHFSVSFTAQRHLSLHLYIQSSDEKTGWISIESQGVNEFSLLVTVSDGRQVLEEVLLCRIRFCYRFLSFVSAFLLDQPHIPVLLFAGLFVSYFDGGMTKA